MAGARHPHEAKASDDRLTELLSARPASIGQIYLLTHRLVLAAAPGIDWSTDLVDGATGYGAGQYGYGGWGMAALMAHGKWVSLVFMRGASLAAPVGVLEGTGKNVRHVKLRSLAEFQDRTAALGDLVVQATLLNPNLSSR